MLSLRLDPDLERLLQRDVDDLAKYNILRYLHDNPEAEADVDFFADHLGLRAVERVNEALESLVRSGLMIKVQPGPDGVQHYRLSSDPSAVDTVNKLYGLSSTSFYGEVVERLAARSLHRARRSQPMGHGEHPNGN